LNQEEEEAQTRQVCDSLWLAMWMEHAVGESLSSLELFVVTHVTEFTIVDHLPLAEGNSMYFTVKAPSSQVMEKKESKFRALFGRSTMQRTMIVHVQISTILVTLPSHYCSFASAHQNQTIALGPAWLVRHQSQHASVQ